MKAGTLAARPNLMLPALTGFIALLIGNGLGRFGYPPLIPALIKEGWFSVSQADYLGAANLTGYIIGAAFGARINCFIPAVYLVRAAVFTVALSFACCAVPLAFPLYFTLRLIAGLAGGIIMVLTAPTIFKHTPTARKGLLSGIIFSGVGMGIALAGTLIPVLVQKGLPFTWFSFAAISLALAAVSWNGWPAGSNEKHARETTARWPGLPAVWNRSIVLLLISYACNAVGFVPHTVFWVDFVSRGLHLGIQRGTQLWVLLGLAAAFGPLISGYMADRVGFAKIIRISLLIKGVGVMMPIFSTAWWSLVLSSVFVGSLALGISSLAAGRITELAAPALQKKIWSRMTITFSVMHALTAYVMSYLFAVYGSYNLLFEIGAVTLVLGCVLDLISSRH